MVCYKFSAFNVATRFCVDKQHWSLYYSRETPHANNVDILVCRYNPAKYSAVDDDVSDMEADFSEIQKEERRRYSSHCIYFINDIYVLL